MLNRWFDKKDKMLRLLQDGLPVWHCQCTKPENQGPFPAPDPYFWMVVYVTKDELKYGIPFGHTTSLEDIIFWCKERDVSYRFIRKPKNSKED